MSGVSVGTDSFIGGVTVQTTSGRGFTPEEITERCLNRIVGVSEQSTPVVRAQAEAFKNEIRAVILYYMKEAIKSDRTTLCNKLQAGDYQELANMIRRM